MRLYHVTLTEQLAQIQQEGLIPQIGPRAQALGEKVAAVYLFIFLADVNDAMNNWLGEWFEDAPETQLTLLAVDLPASIPSQKVAFERQVLVTIPPGALTVLDTNFGG